MNWYMAKLVFRIICGDGGHTAQFDEQIRIVKADSEEEALSKAMWMGEKEQDTFPNEKNEVVRWQFINVPEISRLSNLYDGVEVCSRIHEADNAHMFIETIHRKAEDLRAMITEKITAF